jgi:hypothetical protein
VVLQLGKRKAIELKRKAKAMELATKQDHFAFCLGINRKNSKYGRNYLQLPRKVKATAEGGTVV